MILIYTYVHNLANLWDSRVHGNAYPGAAVSGSKIAPISGILLFSFLAISNLEYLDKQLQKQKEKEAAAEATKSTSQINESFESNG